MQLITDELPLGTIHDVLYELDLGAQRLVGPKKRDVDVVAVGLHEHSRPVGKLVKGTLVELVETHLG